MTWAMLLSWWNLIYLVPLGLALVYLVVYAVTGVSFGDADAQAELAAHVVADVHADVDADADAAGDAHHEAASETPAGSAAAGLMSLVGVGKAPLSVLLMVLLVLWGVIGEIANHALIGVLGYGWLVALISAPVALVGSASLTGLIARLLARFAPSVETYAVKRQDLVDQVGEALYDIDEKFGLVAVRDARGNLYQLPARTGTGPRIGKGTKVLLFDYDAPGKVYLVSVFDSQAKASRRKRAEQQGETLSRESLSRDSADGNTN